MYRDAGPPRPTQVCGVYTVLAMVRRPKDLWETRPVGAAVRIRKNTSTDGPLLPPLLTRQRRRSPEGASEGSEFRVNSSKTGYGLFIPQKMAVFFSETNVHQCPPMSTHVLTAFPSGHHLFSLRGH